MVNKIFGIIDFKKFDDIIHTSYDFYYCEANISVLIN